MTYRPIVVALIALTTTHAVETTVKAQVSIGGAPTPEITQTPFPPAPPQDQGLPYTRSAHPQALARLKDQVAVFVGSRWGYVKGMRVTLDDQEPRRWAAVRQEGKVLVPAAFAGLLAVAVPVDRHPALPYLADRWIADIARPPLPPGTPTIAVEGHPYVDLAALGKQRGLVVHEDPQGLVMIGPTAADLPDRASPQFAALITLFDTPERFADPSLPPRWIPSLIRQGTWLDHVKPNAEQVAKLAGPATRWTMTPASADDLIGFASEILGSPVPAPGVYPRLLFSPQDIPAVKARILRSASGQAGMIEIEELLKKTWWDPATDDGRIFVKLASGDTAGLEFQMPKPARSWEPTPPTWNPLHVFTGQNPGIFNSHIWYVPQCLTSMALWCLLNQDEVRGRQVASAITNYYRLREPFIDQQYATSDTEFGSSAGSIGDGTMNWRRNFHPAQHMDLAFALDFAGTWMTAEQKVVMQRVIAKVTYGRRSFTQDGSIRFRDINWMTWDLSHFLSTAAIEGLPGFDPEVYDVGRESVAAFLEWGISPAGTVFETNGKTGAGFNFQFLAMTVLARRGDNRFGHPHLKKLLEAQAQMTSPTGRVTMNSGTQYVPYSRTNLSYQAVEELKTFYPGNRAADYLLSQAPQQIAVDEGSRYWALAGFDPTAFRAAIAKAQRYRLPGPSYPNMTRSVVFSAAWQPTTRADLHLPLDFIDPVQGVLASRSDDSDTATWLVTMVRPNHYFGAGHHHSDAGMVHVSALGVDWFTQSPFPQKYSGDYYGLLQVDGLSTPAQWAARAAWLGAESGPGGASASSDLTYSYAWRWLTQPPLVWDHATAALPWELEPAEDIIAYFRGTQADKFRPWWPTANSSNWMPTCRAPFNPMRRVTRSIALVRGLHPYAIQVDDADKDGQPHAFTWNAMLNGGVWKADLPGLAGNQIALAFRAEGKPVAGGRPAITPKPGEPLLIATVFADDQPVIPVTETLAGPDENKYAPYDRLSATVHATSVAFRVILTPVRAGETLPRILPTGVAWADQADEFTWTVPADGRSRVTVSRDHRPVVVIR